MKDYDEANKADDDRNNALSDLARDKEFLWNTLREIQEVWIGSEGVKTETATEDYLERLCKHMYQLASDAIKIVQ